MTYQSDRFKAAPACMPAATLRALNDAAHYAARQARKMKDPRADELTRLARETDRLVDNPPAQFATSA